MNDIWLDEKDVALDDNTDAFSLSAFIEMHKG